MLLCSPRCGHYLGGVASAAVKAVQVRRRREAEEVTGVECLGVRVLSGEEALLVL